MHAKKEKCRSGVSLFAGMPDRLSFSDLFLLFLQLLADCQDEITAV